MKPNRFKFRAWTGNKMVRLEDGNFHGKDLIGEKDWIVMQSTGLLDKNGNEIYESDIVIKKAVWMTDGEARYSISEIEWDVDHFGSFYQWNKEKGVIGKFYLGVENKEIKIIGNKFEHEELLKHQDNMDYDELRYGEESIKYKDLFENPELLNPTI